MLLAAALPRVRDAVPALAAMVYGAGALLCHQRPDRSFHLHESQLPVCARCAGLYFAGAIGALMAWPGPGRVPGSARSLLLAAAVPTALTVAAEWAGLASPSNLMRALAALPLGAAAGWLCVRLLRADGPAQQMRYDSVV